MDIRSRNAEGQNTSEKRPHHHTHITTTRLAIVRNNSYPSRRHHQQYQGHLEALPPVARCPQSAAGRLTQGSQSLLASLNPGALEAIGLCKSLLRAGSAIGPSTCSIERLLVVAYPPAASRRTTCGRLALRDSGFTGAGAGLTPAIGCLPLRWPERAPAASGPRGPAPPRALSPDGFVRRARLPGPTLLRVRARLRGTLRCARVGARWSSNGLAHRAH